MKERREKTLHDDYDHDHGNDDSDDDVNLILLYTRNTDA